MRSGACCYCVRNPDEIIFMQSLFRCGGRRRVPHLLYGIPCIQLLHLLQSAYLHGVLYTSHFIHLRNGSPMSVLQECEEQHQGVRKVPASAW
jgi:hypothetical protein